MIKCTCKKCEQRERILIEICDKYNLCYNKLTEAHKTELYHLFVLTEERHVKHNWNIMKRRFDYALRGKYINIKEVHAQVLDILFTIDEQDLESWKISKEQLMEWENILDIK